MSTQRGTGRTTQQLESAPKGSIFVCTGPRDYTDSLAKRLGRGDIRVVTLTMMAHRKNIGAYSGRAIVLDHAFNAHEYPRHGPQTRAMFNEVYLSLKSRLGDSK